jgi:hypothetical protein
MRIRSSHATALALALLACTAWVARASSTLQAPWEGAREVTSNGAGYLLRVRPSLEPIPENEEFALSVWVFDPARPDEPLGDVALAADAGMPEHGHGMNRVPAVARRDDGGFDVTGMLFHMGGSWELYLDVTRGAITERTQTRVELE